jgi:hypothetical protein
MLFAVDSPSPNCTKFSFCAIGDVRTGMEKGGSLLAFKQYFARLRCSAGSFLFHFCFFEFPALLLFFRFLFFLLHFLLIGAILYL